MRRYALYEHAWVAAHSPRPVPVPGLLLDVQPHWVHSVSINPVMHEYDSAALGAPSQTLYLPRLGRAPIPLSIGLAPSGALVL